jgi:AbrB family looped-hinge helix DNA binding protein
MKVTTRGQVTIPQHIREQLGLLPNTDVAWELKDGAAVLTRAENGNGRRGRALIEHMRGRATVKMSTDEIMALTRGEP